MMIRYSADTSWLYQCAWSFFNARPSRSSKNVPYFGNGATGNQPECWCCYAGTNRHESRAETFAYTWAWRWEV